MKIRTTILVCWVTFITLCSLCDLFRSVLPSVLPGIVMLGFRLFIPFASQHLKRVVLVSLIVANLLGAAIFAPAGYVAFVAGIGALASAVICFVAMIRADILVFRMHETVA